MAESLAGKSGTNKWDQSVAAVEDRGVGEMELEPIVQVPNVEHFKGLASVTAC